MTHLTGQCEFDPRLVAPDLTAPRSSPLAWDLPPPAGPVTGAGVWICPPDVQLGPGATGSVSLSVSGAPAPEEPAAWVDPVFGDQREIFLRIGLAGLLVAIGLSLAVFVYALLSPNGWTEDSASLLAFSVLLATCTAPPVAWLIATQRIAQGGLA